MSKLTARPNMKLVAEGNEIVGITNFKNMVIVATKHGVYQLSEKDGEHSLTLIEFINE